MDYGRESIVRDDWKKIFDDSELDKVITRMLRIDQIDRAPV
jgi:D-apionate oxidoisomerase